jgi:hypothetical protein
MDNRILKSAREEGSGMPKEKVNCLMELEEALLAVPQPTEFPCNSCLQQV